MKKPNNAISVTRLVSENYEFSGWGITKPTEPMNTEAAIYSVAIHEDHTGALGYVPILSGFEYEYYQQTQCGWYKGKFTKETLPPECESTEAFAARCPAYAEWVHPVK